MKQLTNKQTLKLTILLTLCLSVLVAMNKNMQFMPKVNEPNSNLVCPELVEGFAQSTSSNKYPASRIEQKMSNEPNLKNTKISATSLSKRKCANFHPITHRKNEPNTNPILPAILSIYAIGCSLDGKYLGVLCALGGFEQKIQNEPNPVLSEVEWISPITHLVNEQRTTNYEQFSNEPNLRPRYLQNRYSC